MENQRHTASHFHILSHKVTSFTPGHERNSNSQV